jgi:DNA processing protein
MNSSTEPKLLAEKDWPEQLWETPEPPEQLYIEGKLPDPEFIYLAVVGSRKFSSYGREACEKIIGELANYPIAIVSGLALGIDTIAHQAALANRLPTVAFPGSGLDRSVLHPHSNRRLADEIVAAGGALVSEFPPTYPAGLHTFPKRNRLMAGLAKATLVIEAGERSGTLITARLALDYNRDVYAVPGSIFSLNSTGTNKLIQQGATPVTSGYDVLQALGLASDIPAQTTLPFTDLSPLEKQIVELLAVEALPRDELIMQLDLSTSETNSTLAVMEIKGIIKETIGEIRLV